ncbi:type II toxin-antitoxin system RelE/ParE family toxin [Leptospira stimsonii]|uniref:Type II toxin-antitoxin system RelE/ParE family toxin n=1 Tax=Leptospira stimsonii TaxID=2202203 RepID=A0ABY2MXA8_9LEPT|nr:type II toxin-antitoxin system RelE/ParE family toxin [Leptospira stimsonii]TGK23121.1 type II toxin-antitoxin system RelE/ParE family toxin [Leptospira stimsonii]TGM10887.1 type II toxin-antitoxin system RelE/ParE family toxin [Leptospira stimsonii]
MSFASEETKLVFLGRPSKKFPSKIHERAVKKLKLLNAAKRLEDLLIPPSNRLHALKGDRKGLYSISIDMQFRIVFSWSEAGASKVEILDYH